jgi:hypothetical protein
MSAAALPLPVSKLMNRCLAGMVCQTRPSLAHSNFKNYIFFIFLNFKNEVHQQQASQAS